MISAYNDPKARPRNKDADIHLGGALPLFRASAEGRFGLGLDRAAIEL
jgi:hypothetical protein